MRLDEVNEVIGVIIAKHLADMRALDAERFIQVRNLECVFCDELKVDCLPAVHGA